MTATNSKTRSNRRLYGAFLCWLPMAKTEDHSVALCLFSLLQIQNQPLCEQRRFPLCSPGSHVRDSGAKSPREPELYPAQVNLFTRNLQKPVEKLIKIWHTGIIYLWGKVFCTLYATKNHREEDLTMTTGKRIFL